MAGTNTPIYPQTIQNAQLVLNNASGTSAFGFYTGGSNGSRISSISCVSSDVARVLNVYMATSSVSYQVGTVNVPANSGTDAAITSAVSILENNAMMPWIRKDSNGRPYLDINPAWTLQFASQVQITSGKSITLVGQIGDF